MPEPELKSWDQRWQVQVDTSVAFFERIEAALEQLHITPYEALGMLAEFQHMMLQQLTAVHAPQAPEAPE